jgi:hypothetical protein
MRFDARRSTLAAVCALAAFAGCQSFPFFSRPNRDPVIQAAPPVARLGSPDLEHTTQWEAGRAIYVGQCTQCHKPKPIEDFAIIRWKDDILPIMSARAKLSPEQSALLADYIMAVKRYQLLGGAGPRRLPAEAAPVNAASASADYR